MNILVIFNVVGVLLLLLSGLLILPIGISFYYHYPPLPGYMTEAQAFTLTLVVSFLLGLTLWKILPSGVENSHLRLRWQNKHSRRLEVQLRCSHRTPPAGPTTNPPTFRA